MKPKTIIRVSTLIAALLALCSLVGLYTPGFYGRETADWQNQSVGQDTINLVLVLPMLMVVSILTLVNRQRAAPLWAGVLAYLTYTFAIYCFDVHFNELFLAYCAILGLSFYSLISFTYCEYRTGPSFLRPSRTLRNVLGIYFLMIGGLFCLLWLKEIVPAISSHSIPTSLLKAGLPTNPVHVLDLSIVLPAIVLIGLSVLRRKEFGLILSPVVLVFFILMDSTIGYLAALDSLEKNIGLMIFMTLLAVSSLMLLVGLMRRDAVL